MHWQQIGYDKQDKASTLLVETTMVETTIDVGVNKPAQRANLPLLAELSGDGWQGFSPQKNPPTLNLPRKWILDISDRWKGCVMSFFWSRE